MSEKKPFRRGEQVFVRTKSPAGLITEHEARVKEMAGARDVVVVLYGRERVVKTVDVRKVGTFPPSDWLIDQRGLPKAKPPAPDTRGHSAPPRSLSATLGETLMAKTPTPEFQGIPLDTRFFCMMLRGARNARTISRNLMADLLRIKPLELDALETGEDLPDDDLIQRLADVLDLPLDQLIEASERSKASKEKARVADEAANQKRLAEAEAAETKKKAAEAREASARAAVAERAKPVMRPVSELPKRTLEDFSERLMDVAPLPTNADRRKQWWTCARILFEIEGAN